jgi:hypothetical protein
MGSGRRTHVTSEQRFQQSPIFMGISVRATPNTTNFCAVSHHALPQHIAVVQKPAAVDGGPILSVIYDGLTVRLFSMVRWKGVNTALFTKLPATELLPRLPSHTVALQHIPS